MYTIEHQPPQSRYNYISNKSPKLTSNSIHTFNMSPRSSPRDIDYEEYSSPRNAINSTFTNSFDNLSLNIQEQQSTNIISQQQQQLLYQYQSIISQLNKLINLKDPSLILENNKDYEFFEKFRNENNEHQNEFFSNLIVPKNIWLKDDIIIKDIKVKVTMLNEINGMMESELKNIQNQSTFEEITLNYYSKLLMAYKFYELPVKPKSNNNNYRNTNSNYFTTLQENDEEDEEFNTFDKPMYRTISNKSNYSNSSNNKNRRASNGSSISKRRFSSFLSNHNNNNNNGKQSTLNSPDHEENGNRNPITPPQMSNSRFPSNQDNISPTPHSQQDNSSLSSSMTTLNSILSKSKLYNKMKKNNNRESTSSINSNISNHSPLSNRSSISTTNTGTTSIGSRRKSMRLKNNNNSTNSSNQNNITPLSSSTNLSGSYNNSSVSSFVSANTIIVPTPILSSEEEVQKKEKLKDKNDYYLQIVKLNNIISNILNYLKNGNNSMKLFKFLDFIKKYLIKFIIIDLYSMILQYIES
ncbi:hypothetical protein KGF54_005169 [Candida jiufengensis]|uniref:uncharacterized protein n=1 Tax=Candida jiufengensis TaxID=497108 RepID=UPI0022257C85|nr:uncharacterized protein KGF54_005169 [Candida jiufengensis]KAI5950352.1 hypothetical protein KGF54_005169 [Candida jiufengensis]